MLGDLTVDSARLSSLRPSCNPAKYVNHSTIAQRLEIRFAAIGVKAQASYPTASHEQRRRVVGLPNGSDCIVYDRRDLPIAANNRRQSRLAGSAQQRGHNGMNGSVNIDADARMVRVVIPAEVRPVLV